MRVRKAAIWIGAVILSLLAPGPAPGQFGSSIVILQSSKRSAYQEVVSGFTQTVTGIGSSLFDVSGDQQHLQNIRQRIGSGPARPAAILAVGTPAATFARREFPDIPLVFCLITNPERHRLFGPNVTGVSLQVDPREQLETLAQAVPSVKRIGVIYNPDISSPLIEKGNAAARELGLILVEQRIHGLKEIANAIKDMMWLVDALWMIPDPSVVSKESFQYLLQTSIERRIPLIAFSEGFVKGGALLALAPDYRDIGRQAGTIIQQIVAGKTPGSIPLTAPKGHLILNLNTAQALGLRISPEVLGSAEKIF